MADLTNIDTTMKKGVKDANRFDKLFCRIDFSKTPAATGTNYALCAIPVGFIPRSVCVHTVKAGVGNITLAESSDSASIKEATAISSVAASGGACATTAMNTVSGNVLCATFSAANASGIVDVIVSGDWMLGVQDVKDYTIGAKSNGDPWPDADK